MDDSIIALAVLSAKLIRYRIFRSEAAVLDTKGLVGGGKVQVTSRSRVSNNQSKDTKYRLTLEMEVLGMPANGGEPAFRIAVEAHGFFEFPAAPPAALLKQPLLVQGLSKHIYAAVVSHIHQMLRALDLQGVKIPPDPGEFSEIIETKVPIAREPSKETPVESGSERSAREKVPRAPRRKPGA